MQVSFQLLRELETDDHNLIVYTLSESNLNVISTFKGTGDRYSSYLAKEKGSLTCFVGVISPGMSQTC